MRRRSLLSIALLSCLPALTGSAERKVINVSTLVGLDPAATVAEQIMTEAYRRLDITLIVHRQPGERSLVSANAGEMDGELYRRLGMERDYPNLVIVPVPLQTYEIVIFSLGTGFPVNGWESLRPFTIGFVRGIKIVEQNTVGMKTEPVLTMEQAFQKLALGRTDVVLGNRRSGLAAIRAVKLEGVQVLEPPLASFPVFHYLHKKNEALMPRLTAVLQQMQKDKTIERIQDAVMNSDASAGGQRPR